MVLVPDQEMTEILEMADRVVQELTDRMVLEVIIRNQMLKICQLQLIREM